MSGLGASAFDAIVVGAGAAGLHAAALAGQRGLRVLLLDHAAKVAEKIRISGGGRCNFTNREVGVQHFFGHDPRFAREALAGYGPQDFIRLLQRHRVPFHEKHRGQLFGDERSERVIDALLAECAAGQVERRQPCAVRDVRRSAHGFELDTDAGSVRAPQLVVATGGLPVPAIGASGWGLDLARQFELEVVEPRPALVPLVLTGADAPAWTQLAGVATPVRIGVEAPAEGRRRRPERIRFDEDLLLTHRGLSGPATLQISTPWREGLDLEVDFLPEDDLWARWQAERQHERRQLASWLAHQGGQGLAERLVARLLAQAEAAQPAARRRPLAALRLADLRDAEVRALADAAHRQRLRPAGTEGWRKAEVMAGGIATANLDPRTMGARQVPGLHFIGEVVDITGWLGGFNFQWAWSSAHACAMALQRRSDAAGLG